MKSLKKILSCVLITSLFVSPAFTVQKNADAAATVNLATFSFSKSDGSSADKSLNDTYKTNADTGYSPKSGIFSDSRLFASVSDPSKSDYRKLEWSGAKSPYTYNNASVSMPVMAASDKNTWGTTPYFLIKTSTRGYENVTMSLILGGSKKGPKDFKIQYSTDNKIFSDIKGASLSIGDNKKMFSYSFALSEVKDKTMLYIRIIASSTTTIEGGSFANAVTSGETAVNDIVIKGSAITASNGKPTEKPSAKPTNKPKDSDGNSNTSSSGTDKNDNGQNTSDSKTGKNKTLSKPSLKSYKAGSSVVRGKAPKKSAITLKTGKKIYRAKASKKGSFKIKLSKKLKKGQVIRLYAAKAKYNNSKTVKYTVK